LFLAFVVDWFSWQVVGWSMVATMTSRLVLDALAMAYCQRAVHAGLIAHSDRSSQYASEHDQAELRRPQIVGSMSGVGQCWYHAMVESTFVSL
jgi:transposase InsO family protein